MLLAIVAGTAERDTSRQGLRVVVRGAMGYLIDAIVVLLAAYLARTHGLWRFDRFGFLTLWAVWGTIAGLASFDLLALRWPVGVLAGIYGAYLFFARSETRVDCPGNRLVVTLVLLCLFSSLYSLMPSYTAPRAGGFALMVLFGFFGLQACLTDSGAFRSYYRVVELTTWLTLAYLVICTVVGGGLGLHADSRYTVGNLKATGTSGAALEAIPVLAYAVKYRHRWLRRAALAAIVFAILLVVASRTRQAFLSAFIVLPVLVAALRGNGRVSKALFVYLGLAVTGLGVLRLSGREGAILHFLRIESRDEALATRVEGRWDVAWPKALERPFFGRGMGMARYFAHPDDVVAGASTAGELRQTVIHSQFLEVFYEEGAAGFVLFVAFLVVCAAKGRKVLTWSPGPKRDRFVVLLCLWCLFVLGMLTHDGLMTIGNPHAYFFWCHSAVLLLAGRLRGHGNTPPRREGNSPVSVSPEELIGGMS